MAGEINKIPSGTGRIAAKSIPVSDDTQASDIASSSSAITRDQLKAKGDATGGLDLTASAPTGPKAHGLLKPGAKGPAVEQLQLLLSAYDPKLPVDGVYGPKTEAAVRKYQQETGLKLDGLAGPETTAALEIDRDLKDLHTLLADVPKGNAREFQGWQIAVDDTLKDARSKLGALRPESKVAKAHFTEALDDVGTAFVATGYDRPNPPMPKPRPRPDVEPVKPVKPPVRDAATDVAAIQGMAADAIERLAASGQLDHIHADARLAAIERLVGERGGENKTHIDAAGRLFDTLLTDKPGVETASSVMSHVAKRWRDRVVVNLLDRLDASGRRALDGPAAQSLIDTVQGKSGDGIDARELRERLARLRDEAYANVLTKQG